MKAPYVYTFNLTIKNKINQNSLDKFIKLLNEFVKNEVAIERDGHLANAKSLLGMFAFKPQRGQNIKITIEGSNPEELISVIEKFFCG